MSPMTAERAPLSSHQINDTDHTDADENDYFVQAENDNSTSEREGFLHSNNSIGDGMKSRRNPIANLIQSLQPTHEDDVSDTADDTAGYDNYNHTKQRGKYDGYCTIDQEFSARDSWELSVADDQDDANITCGRQSFDSGGCDDGEFVSYWYTDDEGENDCQLESSHIDHGIREESAVEAPLGNGNNATRWFQLRKGINHLAHDNSKHEDRRPMRQWGFGKGLSQTNDADAVSSDIDEDRQEYVLYSAPDCDDDEHEISDNELDGDGAGSLLPSSSSNECDHIMPGAVSDSNPRSSSPFRLSLRRNQSNNTNANNRGRRGEGILALPIIRPFLIGSRRGFTDEDPDGEESSAEKVEDNNDEYSSDQPSRRDRATTVQSISEGIAGAQNDSLILYPSSLDDTTTDGLNKYCAPLNPPSPLLRILQIGRLLQGPNSEARNNKRAVREFHKLLRKEDWSLATTVLQSTPSLAQTWHPIQRLYGGRYDGEGLPLHAACALRPPASFVQTLANIYPEGLLAKDKAFARVPLHVACRSLAKSNVIQVLCEMQPECVEARDSLKRVPLHYLIKNYTAFGDDDETEHGTESNASTSTDNPDGDGLIALRILLQANPNCVRAVDYRGWTPLHVAASSSSRKGMLNVLKLITESWPEGVLVKTSKGSDVFDCVGMAGDVHPTKDRVASLLKEARQKALDEPSHNDDCDDEEEASNRSDDEEKIQEDVRSADSDDNADSQNGVDDNSTNSSAFSVDIEKEEPIIELLQDDIVVSMRQHHEEVYDSSSDAP
eukprot:g7520.t1 g7520   contig24:811138-813474(-)